MTLLVDLAFDYRGNVTILKKDGSSVEGYVFNRKADAPQPYLEFFGLDGAGPFSLLYASILTIVLSGKDMAAGASWEARQAKKGRVLP